MDTFPVIKFGQTAAGADATQPELKGDIEAPPSVEMSTRNLSNKDLPVTTEVVAVSPEEGTSDTGSSRSAEGSSSLQAGQQIEVTTAAASAANADASSSHGATGEMPSATPVQATDVQPSAMGHDVCPICIVSTLLYSDIPLSNGCIIK